MTWLMTRSRGRADIETDIVFWDGRGRFALIRYRPSAMPCGVGSTLKTGGSKGPAGSNPALSAKVDIEVDIGGLTATS
jgi:hypothetical protein